jgi:hypothetical protein
MREDGLVDTRREAQTVFYRTVDQTRGVYSPCSRAFFTHEAAVGEPPQPQNNNPPQDKTS